MIGMDEEADRCISVFICGAGMRRPGARLMCLGFLAGEGLDDHRGLETSKLVCKGKIWESV